EKAKQFLKDNPKMMKVIKAKVWEAIERGAAPEEEQKEPGKKEIITK
ncbi:MAG: DNA recombination/repair protein RecA, partial [Candidatus Magasanikbacteria bacterium]|nr:DNA recombination/repair protein RecA [Candidatus Magasanikbacteria bacterium]